MLPEIRANVVCSSSVLLGHYILRYFLFILERQSFNVKRYMHVHNLSLALEVFIHSISH